LSVNRCLIDDVDHGNALGVDPMIPADRCAERRGIGTGTYDLTAQHSDHLPGMPGQMPRIEKPVCGREIAEDFVY